MSEELNYLERISNLATRSEKVSWNRKMTQMIKLLAKIRPIEEALLTLTTQKNEMLDEVEELRQTMVIQCIHPKENLVIRADDIAVCKFCEKAIKIVNEETIQDTNNFEG